MSVREGGEGAFWIRSGSKPTAKLSMPTTESSRATYPISQDVPENIVRRWIRDALALPPEK